MSWDRVCDSVDTIGSAVVLSSGQVGAKCACLGPQSRGFAVESDAVVIAGVEVACQGYGMADAGPGGAMMEASRVIR